MEISVRYQEIQDYVQTHLKQKTEITRTDPKSIKIAVVKEAFITTLKLGITLTVEAVTENGLVLSYSGGRASRSLIKTALAVIGKFDDEITSAIKVEDNLMSINLSKIPQTRQALQYVMLNNVYVNENDLTISLRLR